VLRRALEAACDQARRSPASDGGAEEEAAAAPAGGDRKAAAESADAAEPTLAQRQADAIGTVAEAALAGGLDRGDGRRPVSGGAARGLGGAGGTAGRSRGNVRGRGVGVGAGGRRWSRSRGNVGMRGVRVGGAGGRRSRSRGNAGGGARSRRRIADAYAKTGRTRPTLATAPDVRPVSGGVADDARIRHGRHANPPPRHPNPPPLALGDPVPRGARAGRRAGDLTPQESAYREHYADREVLAHRMDPRVCHAHLTSTLD
jgi:hypothetical protein